MRDHLRLVKSPEFSAQRSDAAPMSAVQVRHEQLWRAAWLLVAGRVEDEGPPFLPVSDEKQAFRSYVAIATNTVERGGRADDQGRTQLPALVAAACWIQLRGPPPPGLIALYSQQVACWRGSGLDDQAILRRLCALLQRAD
jgi:hypothetical protein